MSIPAMTLFFKSCSRPQPSETRFEMVRGRSRFEVRGPRFEVQGPRSQVRGPRFEVRGSRFEVRGSRSKVRGSRFEVRGSRSEVRGSRFEVWGPRSEVRGSRFEVRGLMSEVRGPKFEVRGSRSEVRGSRFEVRGPTWQTIWTRKVRPKSVWPNELENDGVYVKTRCGRENRIYMAVKTKIRTWKCVQIDVKKPWMYLNKRGKSWKRRNGHENGGVYVKAPCGRENQFSCTWALRTHFLCTDGPPGSPEDQSRLKRKV